MVSRSPSNRPTERTAWFAHVGVMVRQALADQASDRTGGRTVEVA